MSYVCETILRQRFGDHMLDRKAFEAWMNSDGEIPFDMYARDPKETAWFREYIPGLIVSSAGGLLPFQAEGLLHGLPFYFRNRHETSTLRVGEADGGTPFVNDTLYIASIEGTVMNGDDFFKAMLKLVPMLEVAPFLWEFSGLKPIFAKEEEGLPKWSYSFDGIREKVHGWGQTATEGFAQTRVTSAYLESHGFSAQEQDDYWVAREIDPTPLNEDARVFPEVAPNFVVNLPESFS